MITGAKAGGGQGNAPPAGSLTPEAHDPPGQPSVSGGNLDRDRVAVSAGGRLHQHLERDRVACGDPSGTGDSDDSPVLLAITRKQTNPGASKNVGWDLAGILDLAIADYDDRAIRG
jgi:hypothetical protein